MLNTEPIPTALDVNQKQTNYRWVIVALLFFATTINYLDRVVISLLKPTLEKEFNWSETDYSTLVVVFQAAYALGPTAPDEPNLILKRIA